MFRSEIRTAVVAAVGAALMSGVVACSSSPQTADQPTAAPASSESAGDRDAFMQCMTDNGVPAPPDGGQGGPGGPPPGGTPPEGAKPQGGTPPAPPGVDEQTWDNARQACASLVPAPPTQ